MLVIVIATCLKAFILFLSHFQEFLMIVGVIVVYGVCLSVECSVESVIECASWIFIVVEYGSVLPDL